MDLNQAAAAPTFECSKGWVSLSKNDRLLRINRLIDSDPLRFSCIQVVDAKSDGQIILRLRDNPSAAERGKLLLDFEDELKKYIDIGLTVWLEPIGDKSSLRKLRGIEVKQS